MSSAEHERLTAFVGVWKTEAEFHFPNHQEPMRSEGRDVSELLLGQRWLESRLSSVVFGQAFEGRGFLGFDPIRQVYVATWADSASPLLQVSEGRFDDTGRLILEGSVQVAATGPALRQRSVWEFPEQDRRILSLFRKSPSGDETLAMRIVYTRT